MPFTLAAFYESTTAAVTLSKIDALADPHIRVSGDDIWVPEALPMLAGYMVLGSNLTRARLESPTLRTLVPIDVFPLALGTEPGSSPPAVMQPHAPKPIGGGEALNLLVSADAAAKIVGLVWFTDAAISPVTGEIFTVKATASETLSAYEWTNGALTFTESLPSGRYQVVGMAAKSAGLIAARLVFPGYAWRPGCIGCDGYNEKPLREMRLGRFGVWGEFDHDLPPTVDFLSLSADTSEEVWLDLIKIA